MAVFEEKQGPNEAGESIAEAAGIVSIPEFDKIKGFKSDSGDVDFYELQLDKNAKVNVELIKDNRELLALYNSQGNVISTSDNNTLNFAGEAGETFFLQLGKDPGSDAITTPALEKYEITLDVDGGISDNLKDAIENLLDKSIFGTENDDTLTGTGKNEFITGYGGDDLITGGGGADKIYGNDGKDLLKGNNGNDTIYGGEGKDILLGGKGSDILYDEGGNDIFYYSNVNQSLPGNLKDSVGLDIGEDRIDLSDIDADIKDSGDQSFDFIGTSRFTSGSTGQVRYDASKNLIQVEVNGDGDTIVDMEIASHKDFSSLSSSDFLL